MKNREKMIELLTGVKSSKRNYYTELNLTVSELQKKNTQLEIINEVMKSFNVEMSIHDMLKNVLIKLRTIFPIERISLSLTNDTNLILTHIYPEDSFYLAPGTIIPNQQSLYWSILSSGVPRLYLTGENKSFYEDEAFQKIGLVSNLLFPLLYKEKAMGILSLGSKENLEYTPSDQAFFQHLSDQLSVCLENARLFNEVLHTKKQWEETFQAVSYGIFIVDLQGLILQANKAGKHYFPSNKKIIGSSIHDLLLAQEEHPLPSSLLADCPTSCEIHLGKKVCECYGYPIFDDLKNRYASIIYIKDVTAKKRIEAQLIQSGKLAAIGEMAAGVAHELNNPLTAIMGNAQLLQRRAHLTEPHLKLLEDIHECGKRSKNIIRGLLTFSRQDEVLFEKCSINQAVHQVIGMIGNQLKKQGIDITMNLDNSLPLIEGSSQQIGQIILNLLLNAKDALEDSMHKRKEIIIQTFRETVESSEVIVLTVTDNGCGMEESTLTEIFHPFFTTKNGANGNGLGLSVSIGIAEAHGGTLSAVSTPGKGSTFQLILPLKEI